METIYREGGKNFYDMLKKTDNIFKSLFTTEVKGSHSIKPPNTPIVTPVNEKRIEL